MKKFLALLLALLMCVGVLASCGGNADDAAGATLDEAKELLNSMMKDKNGKATPSDYDVVGKLTVGETVFEVTWKTDKENIKVKPSSKKDFWTIDVPDVNTTEIEYKITATIKAADGSTVEVSFTPKLPVVDNAGIVTELEAGVAYKIFMKQANLGYNVYALNTTQKGENKYIETTLDPKAAATYYAEVVEGGYKIYTEINGVKNYLHAELKEADNGKMSKYIGFATDGNCVFTYDKEIGVLKISLNKTEYGVGTYNSYETISLSEATYFTKDNVNVAGGQFPIGFMLASYADTLDPSEKPKDNDPKADSTLSIADAIALGNSKNKDVYTANKYYVTGKITEIQNETYGNMVISDGTNSILVYGTYDAKGDKKYGEIDNAPKVGDTVTVYGIIGKFNDAQIKNAWITNVVAGEGGDAPVVPMAKTELVEAPVAGTAYKLGLVQGKANKTVYLTGVMDGYYMASNANAALAADVYLEATTGGYYLYFMVGETKTYINIAITTSTNDDGSTRYHVNAALEAEAKAIYTFDETLKTVVTNVTVEADTSKSGVYAFGTRNDKTYLTAGPVLADAAKSFICQFYAIVEGEVEDTPDVPACENHADANGDYVCDSENCTVVLAPAADSVLTIPQANALGVALGGEYSADKYYVTGIIKEVYNTSYGNMYLKDENGVEFTVYGVTGYADMANKPVAGDVITVYAAIGSYGGNAQMKNATMTALEHKHAFTNGECACGAADPDYVPTHTCEDADGDYKCDATDCDKDVLPADGTTLTIEQAVAIGNLFAKNGYTTEKYVISGTIAQVKDASKGNIVITDGAASIEIYGIKDANGVAFASLEKVPGVGDSLTLTGTVGMYNNAQMKNAVITGDVTYHEHAYENGACSICGAFEPVAGSTTASVVISAFADANAWVNGTKYSSFDIDANVTATAVGTDNTGKYYTSGEQWRTYQSENPTVTIKAAEGKTIVSVKITYTAKNNGTLVLNGENVASGATISVNANSISFNVGNTGSATNGQANITAIEVVYQ